MINLNDRSILSENSGVTFLAAELGDKNRVGIHILKPSQADLEKALDRAIADGYKVIWVHDSIKTFE